MTQAPEPSGVVSYGKRISDLAAADPDRIALVFAPTDGPDLEITWRELDERTSQVARLLASRGAGVGDLVACGLPNSPEHFYVTIGAWKAGAGCVPVRYDLPVWERERVLDVAHAMLLIGDHADSTVPVITTDEIRATTALPSDPLPDVVPCPAQGIASSGSTGKPKIIVSPMPGEEVPGSLPPMPSAYVEIPAHLPQLIPAPLYHTNGFLVAHMSLRNNQLTVVMERFDAARALALIEKWKLACFTAVPTMLARMARASEERTYDLSSIFYVMQGGAPIPDWVVDKWIGLVGAERFYMSYGSSERVGLTIVRADEWQHHRGTVGRGYQTLIRILDDDGNDLPPGEVGEIFMVQPDAPGPSFAYVGAAAPKVTPDGYTSIGDMGRLDDDGFLYIADRRSDMIVTGGANVYPAEVEAALSEHPLVHDVVVVGLPDPEWGRRVHAIVEPTDAANPPSVADLDAHTRARVAAYKVPKAYEIIDRMPRNEAGKINRNNLAAERADSPVAAQRVR